MKYESMFGNKFGVALKDPELRQKAYNDFCDHISKGKSVKSWCFVEGENACTWKTMLSYMQDKKEFPPIKKEIAECQGYKYWESVAEDSAIGKNRKANTASLQMVMRNKFGWDKEQQKPIPNDAQITDLINCLRPKDDNASKSKTDKEFSGS